MASSSFRDGIGSLGWSRRDPAVPATTATSSTPFLGKLQSYNPFANGNIRLPLYENESAGAPLPARTRREEEEAWFALKHLLSTERLPFTAAYFGSIAATLYFALGLHSTLLTLVSSIVQLVCLLWYTVSYFPMGSTGMRFGARLAGNRVAAWMNN
ncbi:hypothetical protein MBLNU457_5656t1 [Dothideomycetes sp. NU457]